MTDFAVNPQTGEVLQYNGQAWAPVDKARVAKNGAGEIRVFDGEAWKPVFTGSPLAADRIQAKPIDEAAPYNPTPTERAADLRRARATGTREPKLPDNASTFTRAIDWLQGFNDTTGAAAHGMTAGLTDEAAGLGRGVGLALRSGDPGAFAPGFKAGMDAENANLANFRADNPLVSSLAEGSGLFFSPLMRLGQPWQEAAITPAGRAVRSAVTGSATGAGTAAAYNEGGIGDRAKAALYGAATGGALGLAVPFAAETTAKGAQTFSDAVAAKKAAAAVPSTGAIKAAAKSEYQKAGVAGLIIKPQAVQNLSQGIMNDLAQFGYHPELQPKVAVVLKELDRVGQGNATAEGIDTMRKIALGVAQSNDPAERALGGMIVGKIDDMMENLSPADVLQGNAQQAASALGRARSLWKTMRKAELLDGLVDSGELQGMSTNSGGNVQNLIRQKLRTNVLENPKNARLFTPEEIKTVRAVVNGTKTQNILRQLGRLAPSSNAWLGIVSTFAAPGVGVAVPMIGAGAKALATRSTKKAIENLSANVKRAAVQTAPQLSQVPTFPLQVRQQFVNQLIRQRLGLAGNSAAGATGGVVGATY